MVKILFSRCYETAKKGVNTFDEILKLKTNVELNVKHLAQELIMLKNRAIFI